MMKHHFPIPSYLLHILMLFWPCFLQAKIIEDSRPLAFGFSKVFFASDHAERLSLKNISAKEHEAKIASFCQTLEKKYRSYGWQDNPCGSISWKADLTSKDGHPLLYAVFGDGPNSTLFLGGVHPDEKTPIQIAFRLANYLKEHPGLYQEQKTKIIIAPLVCPDGFFLDQPLRTNKQVDANRNFPTMDWHEKAIASWSKNKNGSLRYFPGYFPGTELETLFQMQLITAYRPSKIFSIHAPLGFLDYDGPYDHKGRGKIKAEHKDSHLVYSIAQKSENYKVMTYAYYPGSLGNYAGKERLIPTVTLELESTTPSYVNAYWQKFLPGFLESIRYTFDDQKHPLTGAINLDD